MRNSLFLPDLLSSIPHRSFPCQPTALFVVFPIGASFWLDIVLSLAILCYFKFFMDTFLLLQDLLRSKGICVNALVSPIGLSYFTLTMIAYANDIYHKKHKAERNFLDYFLFITYFPSIVQGPVNL